MSWLKGLLICFFFHQLPAYTQQTTPVLTIGKPAPPLLVRHWLIGNPSESKQTDRYRLVEFGSVSCAPCRASIPHLSRLAQSYHSELSVLSVFIFENGSPPLDSNSTAYIKRVKLFVEKQKSAIAYSVAVDDPRQTILNAWWRAAGLNSLPVAFLLDKKGIVTWIGNPAEIDPVLEKLLSSQASTHVDSLVSKSPSREELTRLIRVHQFDTALVLVDQLLKENPFNLLAAQYRFQILLNLDEPMAYKYARTLMEGIAKTSEPTLYYLARDAMEKSAHSAHPDFDLVIELTEGALKYSKDQIVSAGILDLQAKAWAAKRKLKKAIETEQKAISYLGQFPQIGLEQKLVFEKALLRYQELYKSEEKNPVKKKQD
jgi:thiol-disulfide isomerase/thioredoxin